jgi:hypothetical protein
MDVGISSGVVTVFDRVLRAVGIGCAESSKFLLTANYNFRNRWQQLKSRETHFDPLEAELIGIFLQNLLSAYASSPYENRQILKAGILEFLKNLSEKTYFGHGFPALYLTNLRKIRVSCEPCLELLGEKNAKVCQLENYWKNNPAVRVTYYLCNLDNVRAMRKKYEDYQRNVKIIRIKRPANFPFFVFGSETVHNGKRTIDYHGFSGKTDPDPKDGISKDWLRPLSVSEISSIFNEIKKKI